MTRFTVLWIAVVLSACSSTPPPPDWAVSAQGSLARSVDAYLSGNTRVATLELDRARAEVARTGAPERLARLELVHCAAEVASLSFTACPAYQAVAPDAAAPEQAYARYLRAQVTPADASQLPEVHRMLVGAAPDQAAARVAAIADPLSRLVAAAVLLRAERATDAVVRLTVDTASAQGWRRPLMAWLGVALARAQAAGQGDEAARLQRRLDVLMRRVPADAASAPTQ
ncbi:hypothetical protein [Hydrogenophaga defluvii]|uniref:DUF4398 domain-containing protein n=1 Tax=Hydrogenophaga defluvii TaxID=249410 RepID=A0ABW2S8B7_9BURK